jgi:predicted amidohydrolase YtcJ
MTGLPHRWLPFLVLSAAACGAGLPAADLILTGGEIVTMDPAGSRAQAIAIKDGRIIYLGDDQGALDRIGPGTRLVALDGRVVLPGFGDAHVHPITAGLEEGRCDLTDLETANAILTAISGCLAVLPDSTWLIGSSWVLPAFADGNPLRETLDSLTGDRSAYLSSADGHSAWVNSAALRLAGVDQSTPDPVNGRIERDQRGNPSGTLRESAMRLVSAHIPPTTADAYRAGLRRALGVLNQHGITAFMEASGNRSLLETYQDLDQRGELTARVEVAMRADPELGLEQVDTLVAWRDEFRGTRLRAETIKFFVDGVIEGRTAAMLERYTDRPFAGEPEWRPAQLDSMVAVLVERGFSIHIHAIGDRGVRMSLDAIERAEAGRERAGRRHQIAHAQLIHPDDVPRFSSLNVIANFSPLWAYPDPYIVDLTWPALGPRRSEWLYPIGAVLKAHGVLAFGSDWNVSSPIPLLGIEVAVTRRNPRDTTGSMDPLLPKQAITVEDGLRAYTQGAARAIGTDSVAGTLTLGKFADLVVLGQNPFTVPAHRIGEVPVLVTLLGGQVVFGNLDSLGRR